MTSEMGKVPKIPTEQIERATWIRSDFHRVVGQYADRMGHPVEKAGRMRLVRDELLVLTGLLIDQSNQNIEAEVARFDPDRVFPVVERRECPYLVKNEG
ncbi:MAG: hypothetical protein JWO47_734 [Candidatus Saccharibacteria bacterium]|nr:hypothetical protein [Candidatus Saccharibacteria bacterium]